MFSSFSLPFKIFGIGGGDPGSGTARDVDLSPVAVHDIETSRDRRLRTLKHLIKINHANHSIIYHDLQYHNHAPHVRCTESEII